MSKSNSGDKVYLSSERIMHLIQGPKSDDIIF